VVRVEENTLPVAGFVALCTFRFLGVAAASVVGRVDLLSLCQLAVTARWCGRHVPLFRALLVQVAAPATKTTGRLPAVGPDVPKLLAVMALREASLSPIGLHTDGYVAEA
jgi:hypothetical protein